MDPETAVGIVVSKFCLASWKNTKEYEDKTKGYHPKKPSYCLWIKKSFVDG